MTACYLYNRTPRETKEGVWKTPYELFYGKKPMLHFLKAIGSKCWVRLPVHKFHEYQKRSAEGVMVGDDNEKRAYRIWCPFYKEFYTSRDLKFDETRRGYHGGTNSMIGMWSKGQTQAALSLGLHLINPEYMIRSQLRHKVKKSRQ